MQRLAVLLDIAGHRSLCFRLASGTGSLRCSVFFFRLTTRILCKSNPYPAFAYLNPVPKLFLHSRNSSRSWMLPNAPVNCATPDSMLSGSCQSANIHFQLKDPICSPVSPKTHLCPTYERLSTFLLNAKHRALFTMPGGRKRAK